MTATGTAPMRLFIDAWDPAYGASGEADEDFTESSASVDVTVELPAGKWRPVDPDPAVRPPSAVLFVDGIRRVDARAWIDIPEMDSEQAFSAAQGVCASYAAGVVCCCAGGAHLTNPYVRRGLFTTAANATSLPTRAGTYELTAVAVAAEMPQAQALSLALQRSLGETELVAALAARQGHAAADDDLLVVDGPLRGRQHLPRALGYIKTHHSAYLPEPQNKVVSALGSRQRTPVFRIGTSWKRHSWYLRLPCRPGAPWTGIVRVECDATLDPTAAVALANLSQATLPRYASAEYKDHRAPQNLYPIAGLERELRRRLGNPQLLYRALRQASATPAR